MSTKSLRFVTVTVPMDVVAVVLFLLALLAKPQAATQPGSWNDPCSRCRFTAEQRLWLARWNRRRNASNGHCVKRSA